MLHTLAELTSECLERKMYWVISATSAMDEPYKTKTNASDIDARHLSSTTEQEKCFRLGWFQPLENTNTSSSVS